MLGDPPAAAGALAGFPSRSFAGVWHRVWRHNLPDGSTRADPWWFAAADVIGLGGRFDLPSGAGGTCYLASSPVAATLEALQAHLALVPMDELRCRRRTEVTAPPEAPAAADATAPAATGFGVTQGLGADADRVRTQQWAAALRRDGWWALITLVHHDVTGTERACAMFDATAGAHPPSHAGEWSTTPPTTLHDDDALLADLQQRGCRPVGPANLPPAQDP